MAGLSWTEGIEAGVAPEAAGMLSSASDVVSGSANPEFCAEAITCRTELTMHPTRSYPSVVRSSGHGPKIHPA